MRLFQSRKNHHKQDYGQSWEVAAFLKDEPKTVEQITEHYLSYLRFVGLYALQVRLKERSMQRLQQRVEETLNILLKKGWAVQIGDSYSLTPTGMEQANILMGDMQRTRKMMERASDPTTVSKISAICHSFLSVLKLTAGAFSGSVALINDGIDTLMDAFSGVMVHVGIKNHKEKLVNRILVVFMFGTGVYALIEAVLRFFQPVPVVVSWQTWVVSIISLFICVLLGFYQRFIGLNKGVMVLITQSVDSRNHVAVSMGVLFGLAATSLGFPIVDTIIGFLIAVLILKNTIEVSKEVIQEMKGEVPILENYSLPLVTNFKTMRCRQLGEWMLYMVGRQGIDSYQELYKRAQRTLDVSENPMLHELGVAQSIECLQDIELGLQEVIAFGWLKKEGDKLYLTPAGRDILGKKMSAFQTGHLIMGDS